MPGQGLEHLPVHPDAGTEPKPAGRVRGQVRTADAVRAEPFGDPGHGRVPHVGGHSPRPEGRAQHVGVYSAGMHAQVDHELGGQRDPVRLEWSGSPDRGGAQEGDFHRQHPVGFQVLRRRRVGGRRRERHALLPGRRPEQVHQCFVLTDRDELGLHVEAEFLGQQPAVRRDFPGPGGAGDVAGDHVAGCGARPARASARSRLRSHGVGGTALIR